MNATESFLRARDFLIENGRDYEKARAGFRWPELTEFNWAYDYFDVLARGNSREALRVVGDDGADDTADVRGALRDIRPGGRVPSPGGPAPRRPRARDAPQRGGALGDHARRDEARASSSARRRRCCPRRTSRTASSAAGCAGSSRTRRGREVRVDPGRLSAHPRRRTLSGLGRVRGRVRRARGLPSRGNDARRRSPPAVLHLGHDGAARSSCCTRTAATPSATSRRCTGSGCGKAIGTATSARPAGPSTRGAPSSRRGTPARASSCRGPRGSTLARHSVCSPRTASRPSAPRRPCGACSSSRI